MADNTVMRAMLFDFYGGLLTDKQREYFDLHYNEDLSLAEIAEQTGISRQGVWDIIRRAQSAMEDVEKKTGIIKRYAERQNAVQELQAGLEALRWADPSQAERIIDDMEAKLETLKG